jgi:hypothetical protein
MTPDVGSPRNCTTTQQGNVARRVCTAAAAAITSSGLEPILTTRSYLSQHHSCVSTTHMCSPPIPALTTANPSPPHEHVHAFIEEASTAEPAMQIALQMAYDESIRPFSEDPSQRTLLRGPQVPTLTPTSQTEQQAQHCIPCHPLKGSCVPHTGCSYHHGLSTRQRTSHRASQLAPYSRPSSNTRLATPSALYRTWTAKLSEGSCRTDNPHPGFLTRCQA